MEHFHWHLKWNNLFVIPPDFLLTDWDDLPRKSFWMHFWNFKSKWNFCFCKKKLQAMVTRAIYTSLFSWHSFFLKRYYTQKKFLSCLFLCLFFGDSVLFLYKMLADIFLCLTVCLSLLSECLLYFLTYRVMLFSPFSFNLSACALLTWVKSICFWLYGRFPHQNDSEFFPCSKCQSNVD